MAFLASDLASLPLRRDPVRQRRRGDGGLSRRLRLTGAPLGARVEARARRPRDGAREGAAPIRAVGCDLSASTAIASWASGTIATRVDDALGGELDELRAWSSSSVATRSRR